MNLQINLEELREEYEERSLIREDIALKFGCCAGTIDLYAKRHGWKRSKNIIRKQTKLRAGEIKESAFVALREAGANVATAAEVLGLTRNTGGRIEKRRNAYEISRHSLLKKSVRTLTSVIEGRPVGGHVVIDPATGAPRLDPDTGQPMYKGAVNLRGSDVIRAVENVLDREAPKVNLNVSISKEFIAIDLNDYR